jgi:hypothetical protein
MVVAPYNSSPIFSRKQYFNTPCQHCLDRVKMVRK